MEFSPSYSRDLRSSFEAFSHNNSGRGSDKLLNSPSFRKFLQVDMSKDTMEIPTIMSGAGLETISDSVRMLETPLYVLPLYVSRDIGTYKTSDSVIRHLLATPYNNRLVKVKMPSGLILYGGKGLILDSNFKPLLLCTVKCHKAAASESCKIVVDSAVVHVNPIVFLDSTSLISKSIVKKVIPFYLLHHHNTFRCRSWRSNYEDVKIVIDDMEDMFSDAPKGIVSDASVSDALNTFLEENEHLLL